jgi:hypothetical protein
MAIQDHFTPRQYAAAHESKPLTLLNPTTRYFPVEKADRQPSSSSRTDRAQSEGPDAKPGAGAGERDDTGQVYTVWRSRDNRKGRHAVAVSPEYLAGENCSAPVATNTFWETVKVIREMFVSYPVWDVSYDVAIIFTLGEWGRFLYHPTYAKE